MNKRIKKKSKTSERLQLLESQIVELQNEMSNLRRAYTFNHSQTESYFMFLYECNFSENERIQIEKTMIRECGEVKTKDELVAKLNAALSPFHQLLIGELMTSLRNSHMFPHLVSLYFGESAELVALIKEEN